MRFRHFIFLIICFIFLCTFAITYCNRVEEIESESPTEDTSQFVNLTDVVPDAILEIRYYSTYNFVGKRIDGLPGAYCTPHSCGCR